MNTAHPAPGAAWRFLHLSILSLLAVALAYAPMLGPGMDLGSDGQFAQFFETGLSWSDLYAGGWPRYADPNSMAFYPLKFLFPATRAGFDAFVLSAAFVFTLGNGCLAWALTRSRLAAALAVLISPLIGFYSTHATHTSMVHAAAYTPWLFLACIGLSRPTSRSYQWFAMLVVATALSILAGHMQITVFTLLAAALLLWPGAQDRHAWLRIYASAAAAVLLAAGLCAPALASTLAYLSETARSAMSAQTLAQFSLRPFELGTAWLPYLLGGDWQQMVRQPYLGTDATHSWDESVAYLGLGIPVLVLAGLVFRPLPAEQKKLLLLAVAGLLLAMAPSWPPMAALLAELPLISLFRSWSRWQLVSSVAAIQLAAFGLARMQSGEWKLPRGARIALLLAPLALALVALALARLGDLATPPALSSLVQGQALWQLMLALLLAAAVVAAPLTPPGTIRNTAIAAVFLLAPLELAWLARSSTWLNAASGPGAPGHIERIAQVKAKLTAGNGRLLTMAGWGSRDLAPDMARAANMRSLNWYGPFLSLRFSQLTGMTSGGWINPAVVAAENQVLDIYNVSAVEIFAPDTDPRSAGVRAALDDSRRWTRLVGDATATPVFINHRALPRLRVLGDSVHLEDAQALAAITTSVGPDGRPFSAQSTAIVEAPGLVIRSRLPSVPYRMRHEPRGPSFLVQFERPTTEPTLVVLADNHSPFWRAYLDGRKSRAIRVNYNQVGVLVPAGTRAVQLRYRDLTLVRGLALSLLSLLLAAGVMVALYRHGRRARIR